jgi:hypothetical protein
MELHDGQWPLPGHLGLGVELDPGTVKQALAAPIVVIE